MRDLARGLIATALFAAGVSGVARAQMVRGSVVLPDSVTPVTGLLVVGVDGGGTQVARTLSNQRGAFSLRLPSAGTYRLQILRIGYRPMIGPSVTLAADEVQSIKLVYVATAVTLSAINVRDKQTCRVNADTGLGVARVWDEARKAMLMSQTTMADAPLNAEWIEYDRVLDSTARIVRRQTVHTTKAPTTHAFRAVPLALLDTAGYVVVDATGTSYYAPDAEVLLSDTFIRAHCFRIDDSRRTEGLLGLRFEPSRDRADKREILGTMWLDEKSAELRNVDFGYTNLPDIATPIAGGSVEFMRLAAGNWFVRRWRLQMPQAVRSDLTSADGLRRTVMALSNIHLSAVQVAGGEVTQVKRGDSVLYIGIGPRVSMQLVARDPELSPAGASVHLEGTDYSGVADEKGTVLMTPVLEGRYRGTVITPLMANFGMPPAAFEVDARLGQHVDTIALPRAKDILGAACPKDSIQNGEGMLNGSVRDPGGRPVPNAAVTLTWQDNIDIALVNHSSEARFTNRVVGTFTRDDGRWQACGIPRDKLLIVEVLTDSLADRQSTRLALEQPFKAIDLVLHPKVSKVADEVRRANGDAERATALVEFTVMGSDGRVLPGTQLDIGDANGAHRTITTGPGGSALAASLAPGELSMLTRHVGYAPGKLSARVIAGRNALPIVLSENDAPMLDTVRIVGASPLAGLHRNDEVDERRKLKIATVSYTAEQIRERNPVDLWQMLRNVPSIKLTLADKYGGLYAQSARSDSWSPGNGTKPCNITIMVDGKVQNPNGDAFDLRLLPPPTDIYAMEVFAGPASIPAKYSGVGSDKWCGMIAVWSK